MACFGSNPDCCVQPQFSKLIDGFGHLDVKEVLSYLGVSGHDRFSHDGLGTHTLRSRREEWCIRVLWMHTAASAAGDELAAMHPGVQEYVAKCCPTATPGVNVVDNGIFLGHGYTYCRMVRQLRSGSGTYKVRAGWSPRRTKAMHVGLTRGPLPGGRVRSGFRVKHMISRTRNRCVPYPIQNIRI